MADETDYENLAEVMGAAARRLEAAPDGEAALREITALAISTVPGADHAGISWVQRSQVSSRASTHELVDYCDDLQSELHEGPCVQAIRSRDTVIIEDMRCETRWPAFTAAAADRGIGSMISFRLFVEHETFGALNLYAMRPRGFGTRAKLVGEMFASQASVVVSGKRRVDQLTQALSTRDVIGQAKGLLMEREQTTGQKAFQMLVAASQEANVKLADVARLLVDEHENPGSAPRLKRG